MSGTPDPLPRRLDELEREITDHEGRLGKVEAAQSVMEGRLGSMERRLTDEIGASRQEVKEFRDEWRDQRRWWRVQFERAFTETCGLSRVLVERMTPWPLVVVLVIGMVLLAGVRTFGGTVAGQSFHVGQANVTADDAGSDAGISGPEPEP